MFFQCNVNTIQGKTTRIQKYRIQFLWEDVSTVSKKKRIINFIIIYIIFIIYIIISFVLAVG